MKGYDYFYYLNGHFPPDNYSITLGKPKTHGFAQADQKMFSMNDLEVVNHKC